MSAAVSVSPESRSPASRPSRPSLNWKAIDEDPRFQRLHSRKVSVLTGLMVFSLLFYFLLPLGAAYFTDLFRMKIFGVVNFGILFALCQFVVAWGIAYYYTVKAREFDAMAAELVRDADRIGR
jgi:uncharacterized membrane protein (DUF485 family)